MQDYLYYFDTTGLLGNGSVNPMDACMLKESGKWIRKNEKAVYEVKSCEITATNAMVLQGNGEYYAVIKNVPMYADPNVQINVTNISGGVHYFLKLIR